MTDGKKVGLNKVFKLKFPGYRIQQIPEEGRIVQRLKRCGYSDQDKKKTTTFI